MIDFNATLKSFFTEEEKPETARKNKATEVDDDGFEEAEADDGDQAGACKPWITAIKNMIPSKVPKDNFKKEPVAGMELKWAHGFRSFDTRNNLFYNAEGNAVFSTAGVGVVQNTKAVT